MININLPISRFLATAFLVILLFVMGWGVQSQAAQLLASQVDDWNSLSTQNFEIIYPPELSITAERAAGYAESAFEYWKVELGIDEINTIHIQITDDHDSTTYSSKVLPNNAIYIDHPFGGALALERQGSESLLEYIIFQEVGRILDATHIEGFMRDLSSIFGSVVLPSMLKPYIYREGRIALDRTDEAYVRMLVRGAIAGSALPTVAELSAPHTRLIWPESNLQALSLGALFLDYLRDQNDLVLDEIQTINASFPIPSMVIGSLELATDVPLEDHYLEFLQRARASFTQDIRERNVITQEIDLLKLSSDQVQASSPSWSPDGSLLVYHAQDVSRQEGLRWVRWNGSADQPLRACECRSPNWLDSGRIVYVKQTQRLTGRDSGDLYLFDLFTNFEQRLTFDEHVYAISPLGQTDEESVGLLRFRDDGRSDLVFFNINTRSRWVFAEFASGVEPIDFAVGSRSQELAVSLWSEAQGLHIEIYNIDGTHKRVIEIEDAKMLYPEFSFDNQYLLFTSNLDQAYEVHAIRLEDDAHFRVTNSVAGAVEAAPSPDGEYIALVQYGVGGFGLERLPFEPDRWERIDPSRLQVTRIDLAGDSPLAGNIRSAEESAISDEREAYRPEDKLFPTFFVPLLGPWNAGLFTQNADPLNFMSYQAAIGISLSPFELFYDLTYRHRVFLPHLRIRLNGSPTYHRQEVVVELPISAVRNHGRYLEVGVNRSPEQTEFFALGTVDDQMGFDLLERTSYMRTRVGTAWTIAGKSNRVEFDWAEAFKLPVFPMRGPHWLSMSTSAAWSNLAEYRLGGGMRGDRPLRGHSDVTRGSQRVSLNVNYDFPLWMFETACCRHFPLPLFFNELRGNLYVDSGIIGSSLDIDALRVGFGSEVKMRLIFGYGLVSGWLRMGFAYGLGSDRPNLYFGFDQDF